MMSGIRNLALAAVALGALFQPSLGQEEVPRTQSLPGVPGAPFPYVAPEEAGIPSSGLRALADSVKSWVEEGGIVGAEVLVVKDRKIVLHESVGWRDREEGLPLERNSIFRIRSMTKPFTGTAILLLVEEGALRLDDPVAAHLPSWRNPASGGITIRQLLSHTGGFVQGGFPGRFQEYRSLREAVDAVGEAGPQHAPGVRYEYSDVGSATLGAVVEEVSGMPVERFIEGRILGPLGLSDTHVAFRPDVPWASRVNPTYSRQSAAGPWIQYWHPTQPQQFPFFRASGGLYTTILDYARWLTAFTDLTEYPGGRLLSEETVRSALRPAASPGYGLHWEIFSAPGDDGSLPSFGHGGSDGTLAVAFPSRDAVALIFTQSRGNSVIRRFPAAVWAVLEGEVAG